MKAEERKELESNELAKGATSLLHQVKTGHLASPWAYRAIGLTLAVVAIIALVWYLRSETRKEASHEWTQLATASGSELETVATSYPDTVAGRVARLQEARTLLGEQGIGQMNAQDREAQNKGIGNIEKARGDLLALAEQLQDKSLKAACIADAAAAEMALVGVPKTGGSSEGRGSVKTAADFYTRAAGVIGVETPAGAEFTKKAAELTAGEAAITKAALDLYSRTTPLPAFDGSRPGGIIAPETVTPKNDLPPADGVIAPPPVAPSTPTTSKSTPSTPTTGK